MFTNGKNQHSKNSTSNFNVTTPENPLLSKQAFTSKEILVSYTNLQLNPYINNQLRRSQYATLITNMRKLLAAKFFNSSKQWKSRRCLVTKPYDVQNTATSIQERWTRAILSPATVCLNKFCSTLVQLVLPLMALKIILLYV